MKIEDDFLDQEEFDKLQTLMMGENFAWYYSQTVTPYEGDKDNYQFFHLFYFFNRPQSDFFESLQSTFEKINLVSLSRVKANLLTRTPEVIKNAFHVDITMSEEKLSQWTTSIFYVNTNNGYTEFETGEIVESVANRMVTFPADLKHRGTSCTDEKTRVVINFNYFGSK